MDDSLRVMDILVANRMGLHALDAETDVLHLDHQRPAGARERR
jgi:hypothetical protein